jgi:hypothetical protein
VKGRGVFTPILSGRASFPGSTTEDEAAAEDKAAAAVAGKAALGAQAASEMVALVANTRAAAVFAPIRAAVDGAIGRAIAAMLLDKAPDEVTQQEATAALAKPVTAGDRHKTYRAQRAGIIAMIAKLSPEIIAPTFAQLSEDVLVSLDKGEAIGWATPAPNKRGASGNRAFRAHWFSIEVTFQQAGLGCSRDHAIGLTAGVWRGKRPANAPAATLLWGASIEALRKHLKTGEALDPNAIAEAAAEGAAVASGEKASADFMRRRSEYIAAWKTPLRRR